MSKYVSFKDVGKMSLSMVGIANAEWAQALQGLPSIDIVRCRECKHWQPHEQYGYDEDNDEYHDYCGLLVPDDDYYAFMRTADDFCSYGCRDERSNE